MACAPDSGKGIWANFVRFFLTVPVDNSFYQDFTYEDK